MFIDLSKAFDFDLLNKLERDDINGVSRNRFEVTYPIAGRRYLLMNLHRIWMWM